MKTYLTKFSVFLLVCSFASTANAQFQGVISFEKTAGAINVNYKYFVKNENVKIQEINNEGEIDGVQLVNLNDDKVLALSPERKLYLEAPPARKAAEMKVDVKTTEKTKEILGKVCQEVVVINKLQDRKIVYWVTKGNYSFLIPLLNTLNRKEKQALYYLTIKGMEDYWPMVSSEYVLSTGDLVSELKTVSINESELEDVIFEIPSDYSPFDH